MLQLLTITWDFSKGLDLGIFTLRFYSLLFALGFVLGYLIMKRIYREEGIPQEKLDSLLTYVVLATVIGARLGHVFFYQWDYYSQHPIDILKVWEGGLASHGAAIAIIVAVLLYSKKVLRRPALWILDRVVITVALAAVFIRLGNFANSEIYGDVGNSPWQTFFAEPVRERILMNYGNYIDEVNFIETDAEEISDSVSYPLYDLELQFNSAIPNQELAQALVMNRIKPLLSSVNKEDKNLTIIGEELRWDEEVEMKARVAARAYPRSPTQLYEALAYLIIFFILARIYQVLPLRQRVGLLFGLFLVLIFGFRVAIEFMKENQVVAEQGRQFNIGQTLSFPLVLTGLYFIFRAKPSQDDK